MTKEFEYGFEDAKNIGDEWGFQENLDECIPDGTYKNLIIDGVENPSNVEYWNGFNSYFNEDEK